MRHAEFSSALASIGATMPTAATRPTAALGSSSSTASFGRTFSEVQNEVATFIRDGGGMDLSPEGSMWRARSMAAGPVLGANALLEADGEVEGLMAGATAEQQAFLQSIAPWAREAADKLGVAPELVSAHAALESGWGQRPIPGSAGKGSSNNLFGIKATGAWSGAVSETTTTEYVQGQPITTRERFRSYPDAAGAFRDYARMLLDNPRYKGALGVGNDAHAFAQGLAKGGYATDPAYAAKLARLASQLQGIKG
jgi:flagellar protein FlgJ